jgi:hypothetical protein
MHEMQVLRLPDALNGLNDLNCLNEFITLKSWQIRII